MDEPQRLVRKLRGLGLLRADGAAEAFAAVDPTIGVPRELEGFSHLDIPWPLEEADAFTFSPRLCALVLDVLMPCSGRRILLDDTCKRTLLPAVLEAAGAAVRFGPGRAAGFDAALALDEAAQGPQRLDEALSEDGVVVGLDLRPGSEDLVRHVRSGDDWVRMGLGDLRLEPSAELLPVEEATGEPLRNLLIAEGIQRRAWTGAEARAEDGFFNGQVSRTWDPPPADPRAAGVPRFGDRLSLAQKFFHLGYVNQAIGDLGNALDLYSASLQTWPTAEAYTFRSWVYSILGDTERAIRGCKKAVGIDPEFGNAYNDIGAYLIDLGQAEEALAWLDRAKHAGRYEAPHFAFMNAGRAHLMLGRKDQARREFKRALRIAPDYEPAQRYLDLLGGGA